jgi:hypothetical protein
MRTTPASLFDLLFGCWHKNLTFPQSTKRGERRSPASFQTGTYLVCLDCGKEFAYDWQAMRALSQRETNRRARHTVGARVA